MKISNKNKYWKSYIVSRFINLWFIILFVRAWRFFIWWATTLFYFICLFFFNFWQIYLCLSFIFIIINFDCHNWMPNSTDRIILKINLFDNTSCCWRYFCNKFICKNFTKVIILIIKVIFLYCNLLLQLFIQLLQVSLL